MLKCKLFWHSYWRGLLLWFFFVLYFLFFYHLPNQTPLICQCAGKTRPNTRKYRWKKKKKKTRKEFVIKLFASSSIAGHSHCMALVLDFLIPNLSYVLRNSDRVGRCTREPSPCKTNCIKPIFALPTIWKWWSWKTILCKELTFLQITYNDKIHLKRGVVFYKHQFP